MQWWDYGTALEEQAFMDLGKGMCKYIFIYLFMYIYTHKYVHRSVTPITVTEEMSPIFQWLEP